MARRHRLSAPGQVHLISLRGINRQVAFGDPEEYARAVAWLTRSCREHALELHAYALAGERLSLLATPASAGAAGNAMQSFGRHYVRWFNDRHRRRGTLWEGRYRCALIDPAPPWLLSCLILVETEPQRLGLVNDAAAWAWSSFAHHAGLRSDPQITEASAYWNLGNTPFDRQTAYRRRAEEGLSPSQRQAVEAALMGGRAWGSSAWQAGLAERGVLIPATGPRGRPRRRKAGDAGGPASATGVPPLANDRR